MPKGTFFKLPPEKQEELCSKIYRLFVEKLYGDVTISDLAGRAELPVGTFYRYFRDKEDAFLHALAWRSEQVDLPVNFLLQPSYRQGEDGQDMIDPADCDLYRSFRTAPAETVRRLYFETAMNEVREVYKKELTRMKYEGMLWDDLDSDLISYMYATTQYNLEMYLRETGIDDPPLCWRIKKYFYFRFFKHGMMKREES